MDAATAEARIKRMVAWDSDPVLLQADITELVALARRADADGLAPDHDDWTETYDVVASAVEGWRWKMAKAAARVTVSTDGQTISRSDYLLHCQQMIRELQRRMVTSVTGYRYDEYGIEV